MINNLLILAAEAEPSLGERMGKAGLNTAMGIGIVFFSLVFISLIIALEGKIFVAINKKKAAKKATTVETVKPAETEEQPVEEVDDEEEIAAVITAAIYAYEAETGEAVPADGLVVRSIRRIGYCR